MTASANQSDWFQRTSRCFAISFQRASLFDKLAFSNPGGWFITSGASNDWGISCRFRPPLDVNAWKLAKTASGLYRMHL